MKSRRHIWFFISILTGMVVGMLYGWYIRPVKATNSNLEALRPDYRADYVLMVAESYQSPEDVATAISHLLKLGEGTPIQFVQEALITAQELEYSQQDMQLLGNLASNLQLGTSAPADGGEK